MRMLAAIAAALALSAGVAGASGHVQLFVANFSIFSPSPTPGVLKLSVGVPGQPLP